LLTHYAKGTFLLLKLELLIRLLFKYSFTVLLAIAYVLSLDLEEGSPIFNQIIFDLNVKLFNL
jgi:hypothetical protein